MKAKKNIELLIDILEKSKIKSLEVSSFWGFKKIKLSKGAFLESRPEESSSESSSSAFSEESSPNLPTKEPENLDISKSKELETIKAPLVGTVYLTPKEGEPPFVGENDSIKKGQVVCIVEAMKIFNEIESDKDGIIRKILVENEDPVEFGQAIFEIESE